jgi:hypothetical protein
MKTILSLILASVTSLAFAQESKGLSRSVDDDGRDLLIHVSGTVNGNYIDYSGTFKVAGLSRQERVAITDRVLDSLGVGKIDEPIAPLPPSSPAPLGIDHSFAEVSANGSNLFKPTISLESNGRQRTLVGGNKPFTKEVWMDDNGFLHLRYRFIREKEEFVYEKSTDASDKSESEKQRFIKSFEQEIELPAM